MKAVLVVFKDIVAGQYTAPMIFTNADCAVRYFASSDIKNKQDYELYVIANYDANSGIIELVDRLKVALPE